MNPKRMLTLSKKKKKSCVYYNNQNFVCRHNSVKILYGSDFSYKIVLKLYDSKIEAISNVI